MAVTIYQSVPLVVRALMRKSALYWVPPGYAPRLCKVAVLLEYSKIARIALFCLQLL